MHLFSLLLGKCRPWQALVLASFLLALSYPVHAQTTITSLENARDAAIDDAILAGEMLGWE